MIAENIALTQTLWEDDLDYLGWDHGYCWVVGQSLCGFGM
jgi:hypothetical protein